MLPLILLYLATIIGANLITLYFGPSASIFNAFFLIGFDLSIRDWLHYKVSKKLMFLLIIVSGGITYGVNQGAGVIALASCAAFTLASLADWFTFAVLPGSWLKRSITSNCFGALVDSLVFPTIAFGSLIWPIILGQFVVKSLGGLIWSIIIGRLT